MDNLHPDIQNILLKSNRAELQDRQESRQSAEHEEEGMQQRVRKVIGTIATKLTGGNRKE